MGKRSGRVWLLAVVAWLLVAGAAEAQNFTATAFVNQPLFTSVGEVLAATIGLNNGRLPGSADIYVGIVVPGGTIVFFTSSGVAFGSVTDPATFQPVAAGVPLGVPFSVTAPDFFTYQWTGGEPRGDYALFVLVLTAGALADGVLTDDEVLALAIAPFAFQAP
jgi:hypothetical protein